MSPEQPSPESTSSDKAELPASAFPKPSARRSSPQRRSVPDETVPQTILRIFKEIVIELLRLGSQFLDAIADRLETGAARRAVAPKRQGNLQKAQTWWSELLGEVRSLLPAPINQKLSNFSLTAIIAVILIAILWLAFSLFFPKAPSPVATTPVPPRIESPTPEVQIPQPAAPEPEPPAVVDIPIAEPTPVPAPSPAVSGSEAADPENSRSATPNPEATLAPEVPPKLIPSPVPAPVESPRPLKLTPEQKLIASIQDQVAEVSDRYAEGLIQSVQANFRVSRLSVRLGEGWYDLAPSQQDRLANELLKRAQTLDFSKLELLDATSQLLARSPVVGTEMVVLRREMLLPAPA